MRAFLWSKFWIGLVPVLVLAEALTIASNEFLGAAPFLKVLAAVAIFFMTFALVGLATGMGAIYPRFDAENLTQVAGSYGGIALHGGWPCSSSWSRSRSLAWPVLHLPVARVPRHPHPAVALDRAMALSFAAAAALAVATFWTAMQRGIRALAAPWVTRPLL